MAMRDFEVSMDRRTCVNHPGLKAEACEAKAKQA